jgi:aldehyde:ferredoxin oxidoreductase
MSDQDNTETRTPQDFEFTRYHVNLSAATSDKSQIQCEDLDDVLGGIARGFKFLEQHPVREAYDADSSLLLTLGVLSGTKFMTGLRTFFLAYSPLKRSLSGLPSAMWSAGSGKFGTKLRYLGIDEIVFTGRSEKPVLLHITRDPDNPEAETEFRFEDASFLTGRHVNDKIQTLKERFGKNAHYAVIGPSGENYETVRYAAIALSTENQLKSGDPKARYCGRGGMGGILGSKNLLAIVADTKDGIAASAPSFKILNKEVATGPGSARFRDNATDGVGGTWANYVALNEQHAMPERNFAPTGTDVSVPLYRVNVEATGKYVIKDEACYRCGIKCHKNVYDVDEEGKAGKFRGKLDFEPLNLLSSNLEIYDIDQACTLVELVDELALDSISCGTTLSYAMEYNERHKDDGKAMPDGPFYGDFQSALKAITDIGEGRSELLGQGTLRLSEALGETGYAMHCKGVEMPAYLPQTNPGYPWALAGGHMSMRTFLLLLFERETGMDYWVDAITNPDKGLTPLRDDILGGCKFAALNHDQMAEAVSGLTGLTITAETFRQLILRTFLRGYRLEKLQGFTSDDYNLPAESHNEYPEIDLPYFNTTEFFGELKERVIKTFDDLLEQEDLGTQTAAPVA